MKTLVQRVYTSPNYTKALEWGKLVTITGAAQVAVQAIGFISGILVIRLLPTQEYALYTLANTMLGTMTMLADGGIATGVMAQSGKVWQDREKLGAVLATGLNLRKKFAIGSLLIATPVLLYLLRHHDASWLMSVLIVISLIPAFFSALSGTLLQIPLKLRQDIAPLQKNQVGVNIGRLVMLVLTLFAFPWAFVAIFAAGLPQIWANIRLQKISTGYADWSQKSEPAFQKEILITVKRVLPGSIYYCISGQLTIWLISIFGSTDAIAQVGALSRLTMMLSIIGVMFSSLIEPRFARLPNEKKILLSRFLQMLTFFIVFGIFIVGTVWIFPNQVLSILGKNYAGLAMEIVLIVGGSCLSLISGSLYKLSAARGIIPPPLIFFSVILVTQISLMSFLDFSQLTNVLWFSIFVSLVGVIFRVSYFFIQVNKVQK